MPASDVADALRAVRSIREEPFVDSAAWINDPLMWLTNGTGPEDATRRFIAAGGDPQAVTGCWKLRGVKNRHPLVAQGPLPDELEAYVLVSATESAVKTQISVHSDSQRCVASTDKQSMSAVLTLMGPDDYRQFLDRLAKTFAGDPVVWSVMKWQMQYNIRAARAEWLVRAKSAAGKLSRLTAGGAFEPTFAAKAALPPWTRLPAIQACVQSSANAV